MNISALSSPAPIQRAAAAPTNAAPTNKELLQDLKGVGDSLASGDLAAAQKFFDSFQKLNPSLFSSSASQTQLGQDLTSLANALNSQDLKSAREAFASVEKDLSPGTVQSAVNEASSAHTTAKMIKLVMFETDSTTTSSSDNSLGNESSISAYA